MGIEIERKYIVISDEWRASAQAEPYKQGYILNNNCTFRIRTAGEKGLVTFKGQREGISRSEYEYEIPLAEAEEMLHAFCDKPLIEKIRHSVIHQEVLWVVDEFLGANAGLIVAEVELEHHAQEVDLPTWVGQEVSEDYRYTNLALSQTPYRDW